jgi:iron complex outermembrane receptor protein
VTLNSSLLETDRRGATTPTAFADKQGVNATLGYSRMLLDGLELIVDGGVRQKDQQVFSSLSGFDTSDVRGLVSYSFTPRIIAQTDVLGLPTKTIAGVDFYDSTLNANRGAKLSDPPVHRFELMQRSLAAYGQQTVGLTPNTDVSWGARLQRTSLSASDQFDPNAPGAFFDAQAVPLNSANTQHALHLGAEHRFNDTFAVFGRLARSFRTPNVDERIGVQSFPVDFNLRATSARYGGWR